MMDWYFLLTPIAVLVVLLLFRFVGCDELFGLDEITSFSTEVAADAPIINLRLQYPDIAKNEEGPPNGTYAMSQTPIDAGDPNWKSTEVQVPLLETNVTELPRLLETDPNSTSIRVRGAWVSFPSDWPIGKVNPLPELTVEAIVLPEWNLQDLGKYYCVMTLDYSPRFGFGLYAGPDSDAIDSPYTWQVWVGSPTGFQRFETKKPYDDPDDPGPTLAEPTLAARPTYLVVTLSQSQACLYMFYAGRGIDHSTYELVPSVPYEPFEGHLTIGISDAYVRPLFPPFPISSDPFFLYPFLGRIAEVAIYNKVLGKDRILAHGNNAFYNL